MNRHDWQWLATERIGDARVMLAARRWSAAYYLTGYAVECALKSCVLVRVGREAEVIFVDKRFSEKCWTHTLKDLLNLANLQADLDAAAAADAALEANWRFIKDWSEDSRYARIPKDKAERLYKAVADKKHGVLQWMKARW